MAKAFSVASWNVEHFKGDPARADRVIAFLAAQSPDVFALYEVEGTESFEALVSGMPGHTFHITEGQQVQEILVGVRQKLTAFFTQKTEFRSGASAMRPGALLTITVDGEHYPLLFLHTASMNDPRGLGLRDDMLLRACEFRKTLNKAADGCANFIFMGDFNTMGMKYKYVKGRDIKPTDELTKLAKEAEKMKMRMLTKDGPATWSNGSKSSLRPSNLDHVVAAEHLGFKMFNGAEVTLRGWPQEGTIAKQDAWIRDYSDHALMYFEVEKVQ